MDLGIKDKVAVVTGAARGLGKADCMKLTEEGVKVAVVDILDPTGKATAKEINDKGGKAIYVHCDITDRAQVKEMVAAVEKELGPIDILINNAAIVTTVSQLPKLPDELWDRDLLVNLTGTYNCTKAIYPGMCERGWGRIVCMASIAGLLGGFGQVSYSTTKIGVVGFARSVALEGARKGVTCNVVAPGIIGTEMLLLSPLLERMRNRVATRKEGEPDDIANTILFLCSQQAKYITGAVIHVMGGMDLFTF
ncbi:MAG: SDR family NAD(P)-dependent oxidoreductase [bacterium]